MSMIRAARAILFNRAAEFGHRQHNDVPHSITEVSIKGFQPLTELTEPLIQLPRLVRMSIPSSDIEEADFKSDIGFDELRHLEQSLSKLTTGIAGAVFGLEALRICALQHADGIERGVVPHRFER